MQELLSSSFTRLQELLSHHYKVAVNYTHNKVAGTKPGQVCRNYTHNKVQELTHQSR
ncbi:hypothetical protein HYD75_03920 [Mycoplasmopsis bovis]|nr:hypothetical protein [Mycoplasmopsis bovis]QQH49029.1 hypothetical protein HYD75_03920 [Mycoplasmopsis bovis]